MAENVSQLIKTLEKTLEVIDKGNKIRDKESERRHNEMEKMLDLSTTKISDIRDGIEHEMKETRNMIRDRYDYFGALLTYLTAIMTGLIIYFVIAPIETSEGNKSILTLISILITAAIVFYIWFRTHRRSYAVETKTDVR